MKSQESSSPTPNTDKTRLRDLSLQLQELEAAFSKKIASIRRQLHLLSGDTKPVSRITEFRSPSGRTRQLK